MNDDPADEREEREHRVFVNLMAAIAMLVLAIAAIWLLRFMDDRRKIESCLEAGRRDCLQRYEPTAAR